MKKNLTLQSVIHCKDNHIFSKSKDNYYKFDYFFSH